MGTPHTFNICTACREPIVQWNNTGPWEHLAIATADGSAKNSAMRRGTKSGIGVTICNSPKKLVEQNSVSSRNTGNYRTAAP